MISSKVCDGLPSSSGVHAPECSYSAVGGQLRVNIKITDYASCSRLFLQDFLLASVEEGVEPLLLKQCDALTVLKSELRELSFAVIDNVAVGYLFGSFSLFLGALFLGLFRGFSTLFGVTLVLGALCR